MKELSITTGAREFATAVFVVGLAQTTQKFLPGDPASLQAKVDQVIKVLLSLNLFIRHGTIPLPPGVQQTV